MQELESIKRHVDHHGFGCALMGDHVAISIAWRSDRVDGLERRLETVKRAASLEEACVIIGCKCMDIDRAECVGKPVRTFSAAVCR